MQSVSNQPVEEKTLSEKVNKTVNHNPQANPSNEVSGLSLKSIKLKLEAEKRKNNQVKVDLNNLPKDEFTQEQLERAWEDYIEKLESKGQKIHASNLRVTTPVLCDDFVVKLEVSSHTMEAEIREEQLKLMPYLHQLFNNYHITLKMEITERELSKSIFTIEEKYERLNEINPLLSELREQFGLDF